METEDITNISKTKGEDQSSGGLLSAISHVHMTEMSQTNYICPLG